MNRRIHILRHAKRGRRYDPIKPPSPEAWAAAEGRRHEITKILMGQPALRDEIDDHVQYMLPFVAHAWDQHRPELGSSWGFFGMQPVYFRMGKLITKVLNRGIVLTKQERRRRAEQGERLDLHSIDMKLPSGDLVSDSYAAPPPPDRAIRDAVEVLRRWIDAREPRGAAEAAALEVMRARAHGDEEITLASAGRRYNISRERVRQLQAEIFEAFRLAHPELAEIVKEAA